MLHPLQAAPLQRALLHPLLLALHLPAQPQAPVPGLPVQRLQDLLHLQQEGESLALLGMPEGQVSVLKHADAYSSGRGGRGEFVVMTEK